jgi:NADPH:quinone reductase-like Zn-dependent oxidoreductase
MKYKSVVALKRGGPDVLKIVEHELRPPNPKEVRVKVLAAPVSLPDVEARYGRSPFPPKLPFTPGYAVIGVVDAVGDGVVATAVGDWVAALTAYGGYAEFIYLRERRLIPISKSVDPIAAAPLILNYIVAYQSLHRAAKVKSGDRVLIIGASGGIGTAFLQLGQLANLTMYGIASKNKHAVLTEHGVIPIDYRTQDFVELLRQAEPEGLDAVFDGIGGDYVRRGFGLLKRGGAFVSFANPLQLSRMFRLLGQSLWLNLLPNGSSFKLYSTGRNYLCRRPFLEDWATLFQLLEAGKIKPVIMETFPILEAAQANTLLESGQVVGNVVLAAPELL